MLASTANDLAKSRPVVMQVTHPSLCNMLFGNSFNEFCGVIGERKCMFFLLKEFVCLVTSSLIFKNSFSTCRTWPPYTCAHTNRQIRTKSARTSSWTPSFWRSTTQRPSKHSKRNSNSNQGEKSKKGHSHVGITVLTFFNQYEKVWKTKT